MTAIHLENLSKSFGAFTALKGMNLDIADGEFVALLGPSGCGKSTTMNMISGLLEPSEGSIRFGERDMRGVPMGRRGVGFVFQNYAIFTHMSVYDNLAYGLKATGVAKAERDRRVKDMAEFLHLTPMLNKPSAGLSVNILQRLAIGRSAIMEPAIFLLDEPLSNVDAAFRAVMRTELKHLQRQFRQTMVYVTHDQLEAMTMADRIAVMDHGKLLQVGTPIDVYNNPSNVFVAGFLGSPGMNLLKGMIVRTDLGMRADLGDAGLSAPLSSAQEKSVSDGQAIVYGFRPEHCQLTGDDGIRLPVTFVERIGARTILHLGNKGASIKGVFDNDVVARSGEIVTLSIDHANIRLFDAGSGDAIVEAR
ncbi:MAG: ABC transporter ATP-binding protein [Hoeflea sp.]|uniref:ABC transporter ATP-binding protein n=1 Tax=Hoeflea sp. TaxID=1940281 RepID=UPI002731C787|nr:ABC transporter ATP-binding protein [Hoeflea sp.]MDP2119050.1 ABC transporter ATP-binding protein [Hoeflea sp.]